MVEYIWQLVVNTMCNSQIVVSKMSQAWETGKGPPMKMAFEAKKIG